MSRALRVGVLSSAKFAVTKMIPGFAASRDCEVVAIASRDLERAQGIADRLGIAGVHGSYDAMLEDSTVDAVYVPLPNHLHAEWAVRGATAGKHVLCEKPLALTVAEAEGMAAAAAAAGVVLMEAFMYRLHPSWVAVRELLASGRIGELRAVQSWFSYFNDDPANIRNVAAYGGGALYDIGCYCVNLSRMLFCGEPERVEAAIARDPATGVDVLTTALLEFRSGVASFACSTRVEPDQRVHVYGTSGRIEVEIPFNIPPERPARLFVTAGGDPPVAPATEVLEFEPVDQYAIEADAFAAAVRGEAPAPVAPDDSIANLRVIERILAAAR